MQILRSKLGRKDPFGFSCLRCLQCCRQKKIQVNPYEIARLAGNLGISTTEFIARYTVEQGAFLKFDTTSTCLFLDSKGCGVHKDRPLVCRLYPLGRQVNDMGDELFLELQPEAACNGRSDQTKTIEDFLENQDTKAYTLAADAYLKLLWEMMEIMEERSGRIEIPEPADLSEGKENALVEHEEWMDMDAAVRKFCRQNKIIFPDKVEEKMHVHLDVLRLWINQP